LDVVRTITGMRRKCGSALISRSASILPRHVQIEQDESRCGRRGGIGVSAALVKVIEELFAIFDETKIVHDAALHERVGGQHPVFFVIVGEKDDDRFCVCGHGLPWGYCEVPGL
jgi:hypothetical protein